MKSNICVLLAVVTAVAFANHTEPVKVSLVEAKTSAPEGNVTGSPKDRWMLGGGSSFDWSLGLVKDEPAPEVRRKKPAPDHEGVVVERVPERRQRKPANDYQDVIVDRVPERRQQKRSHDYEIIVERVPERRQRKPIIVSEEVVEKMVPRRRKPSTDHHDVMEINGKRIIVVEN